MARILLEWSSRLVAVVIQCYVRRGPAFRFIRDCILLSWTLEQDFVTHNTGLEFREDRFWNVD